MAGNSWKLTFSCTRAEAEAIDVGGDLGVDRPSVITTSEEIGDDNERWRLDVYWDGKPDENEVEAIRALVPSAHDLPALLERLDDADWVTMSQAGLEPIAEGRFIVHTSAHPAISPPGGRAFLIDAGPAFGTGHHATTSGCLRMLDGMADRAFANIIDIGTGTGLLAFAAKHLWPDARVAATDIDPAALDVTRDNMATNDVAEIDLIIADGALDERITATAPYDLIIANVLAGPLVSMAPELAAIAAPRATIMLAGLLETQRTQVVDAYTTCGCTLIEAEQCGDWTILKLSAGVERYVPTKPIDPKGRDGWALDL